MSRVIVICPFCQSANSISFELRKKRKERIWCGVCRATRIETEEKKYFHCGECDKTFSLEQAKFEFAREYEKKSNCLMMK